MECLKRFWLGQSASYLSNLNDTEENQQITEFYLSVIERDEQASAIRWTSKLSSNKSRTVFWTHTWFSIPQIITEFISETQQLTEFKKKMNPYAKIKIFKFSVKINFTIIRKSNTLMSKARNASLYKLYHSVWIYSWTNNHLILIIS